MQSKIYLATIALEPNRWSSRTASIDVLQWMDRAAGSGFDGVEVWEPHYVQASPEVQDKLYEKRGQTVIFNSYLLPESGTEASWERLAEICRRLEVRGLKFNFGPDETRIQEYVTVLSTVRKYFPDELGFLCECHPGTVAEQPEGARSVLSAAGLEDVGIICHPFLIGEAKLTRWLDIFGPRVQHMHVQMRDAERKIIRLRDKPEYVNRQITLLHEHGFEGTWTVEFVFGTASPSDIPETLFTEACKDRDVLATTLRVSKPSGDR